MRDVVTILATEEQLVWNSLGAVLILLVTIAVRLLARQSIIEETLIRKLEREIDMEETRIKSISNAS